MKNNGINGWVRLLVALGGAGLFVVLALPIWRIELEAPQYPEGLVLQIFCNALGGDVDIINGLNHYIGMKTLHTEDFIEFTLLPWLVSGFGAFFILVALLNKRPLLYALLVAFIVFGIVAMSDFYRWNYNYGHDLDPNAAIKVPGMAYQPPLIGYKQLLNFGAYSIPDTGGWIFISSGLILCVAAYTEWRRNRKVARRPVTNTAKPAMAPVVLLLSVSLLSCSTAPQPIQLGTDVCYFCKMTISDARFGAEIVTRKGKFFKFDDAHCLLSYVHSGILDPQDIAGIYLVDFCGDHALTKVETTFLLQSEELRSPMGGNIAAFTSEDSLNKMKEKFNGTVTNWATIFPQ